MRDREATDRQEIVENRGRKRRTHSTLNEGENGGEELTNELSVEFVVGEPGSSRELDGGSKVVEHI